MANRGALDRAPVKAKLCRALAAETATHDQLAQRYGVTRSAVSHFAKRHAGRIAEIRERIDDQYAGIVYADKVARVAELSDQVEAVADLMADPESAAKAGVGAAEMYRTVQTALRAIADELGQIPSRSQLEVSGGVSVRYEIVGCDPADLS